MVELTEEEAAIAKAALQFVADSPVGFEAIYGWVEGVDEEDIWELAQALKDKL